MSFFFFQAEDGIRDYKVTGVQTCALPISVVTREVLEQMPLFGPRGASPTQLATAVARLSALVGPEHIGRPQAPDRWMPFAAGCGKFAPPPPPRIAVPAHLELSLAARALRPPRTAEVRCDDSGIPLLVIGEGALGGPGGARAGPLRTVGGGWEGAPVALD